MASCAKPEASAAILAFLEVTPEAESLEILQKVRATLAFGDNVVALGFLGNSADPPAMPALPVVPLQALQPEKVPRLPPIASLVGCLAILPDPEFLGRKKVEPLRHAYGVTVSVDAGEAYHE